MWRGYCSKLWTPLSLVPQPGPFQLRKRLGTRLDSTLPEGRREGERRAVGVSAPLLSPRPSGRMQPVAFSLEWMLSVRAWRLRRRRKLAKTMSTVWQLLRGYPLPYTVPSSLPPPPRCIRRSPQHCSCLLAAPKEGCPATALIEPQHLRLLLPRRKRRGVFLVFARTARRPPREHSVQAVVDLLCLYLQEFKSNTAELLSMKPEDITVESLEEFLGLLTTVFV